MLAETVDVGRRVKTEDGRVIVTSSANAREFLDYYLDLDGDPEFAVLLEGP